MSQCEFAVQLSSFHSIFKPCYACLNGGDFFSSNSDTVLSCTEPNQSNLSLSRSRKYISFVLCQFSTLCQVNSVIFMIELM